MKFGRVALRARSPPTTLILELLQENCKQPLAAIGEKVGLSAPSVLERIHKLEEAGRGPRLHRGARPRKLGRDVTAFIGVSTDRPRAARPLEREVERDGRGARVPPRHRRATR